ncbi:hypothetical protein NKW84_04675 [Acetobacter senegalensis]|uniref:hypothetical protein n=1 Tax=Acetobacter senegalensis TaxID=446692 RepID=UPI00142F336C|nr:hypothetical protein [Acetobacter senegalensis]MCP1195154.1 hypothetical protein [Acetobacter senegalensis]
MTLDLSESQSAALSSHAAARNRLSRHKPAQKPLPIGGEIFLEKSIPPVKRTEAKSVLKG